jgi:predicted kinase
MTTDTPRTDAYSNSLGIVPAEFARELERELAHSLANQVKTQAEVERLREALKSCWHAANTYDGNYTRACDNVMHIVNATLKIANPEDK